MNPGPGQERGDRRRLAGQTGSSQVIYMCVYIRGVQLTVIVCTVQVMIVKMTIHKGTKGK